MIIYATKQIFQRYHLKTLEEMIAEQPASSDPADAAADQILRMIHQAEEEEPMLQWGAKLFYFDRRKCLLLRNFASRLTLVLPDFKVSDMGSLDNAIKLYLKDIYARDSEMLEVLDRYFEESPICFFEPLTDRRVLASLNHAQTDNLRGGDRLADYIRGGIMHSLELNRDIAGIPTWVQRDGKRCMIFPKEEFAAQLKALAAAADEDGE